MCKYTKYKVLLTTDFYALFIMLGTWKDLKIMYNVNVHMGGDKNVRI